MFSHSIASLFLEKLEARRRFSDAARGAFLALPAHEEEVRADRTIVRQGERSTRSCLLREGFLSRSKDLRSGDRQIVAFHVPGDLVDLQSVLVMVADHTILAHVASTVVSMAHADLLDLADRFPEIGRAMWFSTLVDSAIFREWTLNVGRRDAMAGTAHLLLELHYRLRAAGRASDDTFEMPVTQSDLADALGLSAVHVNRSLQSLRGAKLIRTFRRTVEIEDMAGMIELAEFDPTYINPEGPRQLRAD